MAIVPSNQSNVVSIVIDESANSAFCTASGKDTEREMPTTYYGVTFDFSKLSRTSILRALAYDAKLRFRDDVYDRIEESGMAGSADRPGQVDVGVIVASDSDYEAPEPKAKGPLTAEQKAERKQKLALKKVEIANSLKRKGVEEFIANLRAAGSNELADQLQAGLA